MNSKTQKIGHTVSFDDDFNPEKPPAFAESLIEIFNITGIKTDFSKPMMTTTTRMFTDEKGTFREMGKDVDNKKQLVKE